MADPRPQALAGIRALDLTTAIAGPYCTRLLADLGAEVIRGEAEGADFMRLAPPMRDGRSAVFGQLNAGKRSIRLDLHAPDDVALARRIARDVDIVVENFRPGTMARFGLGYEQLAALNPRLIYCSISGFGQTGPLAGFPAYAPMIHAMCGHDLAQLDYQDGIDRPLDTAIFTADILGGSNALSAILAALVERGRSGQGQWVESTLLDGMLSLLTREVQVAQVPPIPRRHVYRPLECADGFVVIVPLTVKNFVAMGAAISQPDLIDDPRFVTSDVRARHWEELMALVETWTRRHSAAECEHIFMAAGLPASRYRTVREALNEPALRDSAALSAMGEDEHRHVVTGAPFRLSRTPPATANWVADLDRDGEAIRAEFAARD